MEERSQIIRDRYKRTEELGQIIRGELRGDNNSKTEEVLNDETREELQPEDEVEQTENEGDSNTCLLYTSRCV